MDTNLFSKLGVILQKGNIFSQMIDISPEIASEMLTYNINNRRETYQLTNHYANEIANDNWDSDNGESIKFNYKGGLDDGQHRLLAIVKAGKTVRMLVVFNTNPESFKTIDTGKNRNASDVLSMQGYSYTRTIATAVRTIFRLTGITQGSYKVTNSQILNYVKNNPDIIRCAEIGHQLYDKGDRLFSAGWLTSTYFILSKINEEDAYQFVYDMATGENLNSNDWVYVIRQKIAIIQRSSTKTLTKLGLANYTFHAWNLRRTRYEGRFKLPTNLVDISKLK